MGVDGTKLGNYELLAEIANGSTTDVLLARVRSMAGFERHVVIKRVHEECAGDSAFTEAFITEARLAATLHHHNIVQVQDIAQSDGIPYFAMEYVHGEDLRALLAHVHARRESIPIPHVITIGLAVAAALHHAHERGIVHRDVTPANILVGYDGNVKVVDFGMAKAAITPGTQVGIRKGKAPYMAPEQCTGEKVDRRSDVFALGIVLYELVTARRLFKGASDHDTMSTITYGSIPSPRAHRADLAPELSSILMKALSRLPNDRYQSAADLALALETYSGFAGAAASSSSLGAYLCQQLGERHEPWLAGGSVRTPAPVDFDGKEPGIAVPAGGTTEATRPDIAAAADDDEMAEETATEVDLPAPPALKPKAEAAAKPVPAAKAIPSLTGKSPGGLKPGAFMPKGPVAAPAPKATAFATAGAAKPSAAPAVVASATPAPPVVASSTPAPPVVASSRPAPPVVAKSGSAPPIAAGAAAPAETHNWDAQSTNVPRLPPPPRVAPRISTPAAMPKLEAAAAALDGRPASAPMDPRALSDAPRRRRGSTAPITSEIAGHAGGEIIIETKETGVDMTEQVSPLPLELPGLAAGSARAGGRRRVLLAAVGCGVVFVVIVVAIAFSGGSSSASSTASPSVAKPSMPAPSAAAAAEPAPALAPSGEMTWNGVLDAGTAAAPAAATIDAAVVAAPEATSDEATTDEATTDEATHDEPLAPAKTPDEPPAKAPDEPPVKKSIKPKPIAKAPAKPTPARKPVPVAKPATKPAKPAKTSAPLKYDPDALFLRK